MATGTSLPAGGAAQIVGKVQIVHGTVRAQAADGTIRVLQTNDPIFANERIITGADGMIAIAFGDAANTRLDLGRMSDVLIDEDVFSGEVPADLGDAAAEVASIQQALTDESFDPTTDLEAPAAGPAATDITAAGGSHDYVKFDLTADEVTPVSGAETIGIARDFVESDKRLFEVEEPVIQEVIVEEEVRAPSPRPTPATETSNPELPPVEPPPPDFKPVAGNVVREIDEKHFANGTAPNSDLTITSGTRADLGVNFPGDLPGRLVFGDTTILLDGSGDSYSIVGKYGTLTVNDDGSWSYTLDDNIDHPDNDPNDGDGTTGTDDSLPEVFNFSAVDANGSTAPGSITINILDDGPVINLSGGSASGAVQEDALGNEGADPAAHDNDSSIGNLDPDGNTDTVTLDLADLVTITPGADNPATVTYNLTGLGTGVATSLTSGGSTVYYHQIGNTIVATTSATPPTLVTDPNVFTFSVDTTSGQAVFNLNDQLDHTPGVAGTDDDTLSIDNLGSYVQVSITDTDGDNVTKTLDDLITVTVENDVPAVTITPVAEASVTGQVLEDGLSTSEGDTDDNSEGYREDGESLTSDEISGGTNLTSLFTAAYAPIGADEPGTPVTPAITVGLTNDLTALENLTPLYSNGVQLSYKVEQGNDADTLTATAGVDGNTVFTLVVNHDGTWSFDLDDQLDHIEDGDSEGDFLRTSPDDTTGVQGIDFSSILVGTATGTDFDGDQATATTSATGSFVVTVVDDVPAVTITPVAEASVTGQVLEDGLSTSEGDTD
ncbi:retention module-containing protein, partial [Desulfoprunum benzoelyticum]